MPQIIRSEPWEMKNRNKGIDNQKQQGGSKNIGGGNNPTRTTKNRNKSGDHMVPDLGAPDRLKRSGNSKIDGGVPDLAGHPAKNGRNKSGDYRTPKINVLKPNNKLKK